MGSSVKLKINESFPKLTVTLFGDKKIVLGEPREGSSWKAVFIYRGLHCPICTDYLNQLETLQQEFYKTGIDIIAVSADTKEKLITHKTSGIKVTFPIAYGLTIEQMEELGLYISYNTDDIVGNYNFSEPGLFIINEKGNVHVADISNAPFARPDLKTLIKGLKFIRSKDNYPIRGTEGY
ncbi:redoxin domain-containing protein [Pseudoalteromonas sp. 2CM28B]|uniref:redoxin domain-containing protein n=1 Tax=Pseudoalteromonas sp. 2CM28B TaxID=2929851 RepID=UPI0020C094BD|nr:redoxin domain-containing protein [Pseudoalteromonas sp. 2CM28B]MCK8131353.1 redoxin domain-containing protein [Pseudoalteromonas sp. 2CM28B]